MVLGKGRTDWKLSLANGSRQYVSDQENPPAKFVVVDRYEQLKSKCSDVEGDPGWYKVSSMSVRPHFKLHGREL
ncbi:hypothetical protein O9992_29400 [Vibrio lentus]|nr:hypothetical protein [Vibrio lentus]